MCVHEQVVSSESNILVHVHIHVHAVEYGHVKAGCGHMKVHVVRACERGYDVGSSYEIHTCTCRVGGTPMFSVDMVVYFSTPPLQRPGGTLYLHVHHSHSIVKFLRGKIALRYTQVFLSV